MTENSFIKVKNLNLIADLDAYAAILRAENKLFEVAEGFELSDNMAEVEALDPRTDIFSGLPNIESFDQILNKTCSQYKTSPQNVNSLFDCFFERLWLLSEGQFVFQLFLTCSLYHSPVHLNDKQTLEFLILGSFHLFFIKMHNIAQINGLKNHSDLYIWYLPHIKIYQEEEIKSLLANWESKTHTPVFKQNSSLKRKKIGSEEIFLS